jgi:hypothetical protein
MEKKSVGLLELEMAVLECFLEKTPLSPLGVKEPSIEFIYYYLTTMSICNNNTERKMKNGNSRNNMFELMGGK